MKLLTGILTLVSLCVIFLILRDGSEQQQIALTIIIPFVAIVLFTYFTRPSSKIPAPNPTKKSHVINEIGNFEGEFFLVSGTYNITCLDKKALLANLRDVPDDLGHYGYRKSGKRFIVYEPDPSDGLTLALLEQIPRKIANKIIYDSKDSIFLFRRPSPQQERLYEMHWKL